MSNIKESLFTNLDSTQVLRDIHNEEDRSIRVLVNNDLVPNKFTKVVCTYNVDGEIATATYYDAGVNQLSSFIPNPENGGQKEITYVNVTTTLLHGKYLIAYDSTGKVGIQYVVDGASVVAPIGTTRNILINISSMDNARIVAIKSKQIIELDAEFLSFTSGNAFFIISSGQGNKPDSYDVSTGLMISSVNGESADTLNNKFFFIHAATSKFHVWMNVDSTGTDPAPALSTPIEVNILSTDSTDTVIDKIINAFNETIYFGSYRRAGRVFVYSKIAGPTTEITDFNTNFNFFTTETFGEEKQIIKTLVLSYDVNGCLMEIDSF